ncbi:hypothetical protein LR48_Vigan03g117900 [Vigna angularis]|uniref:Uncharacterized protein n=1 Tax=Phaseolus angularis TaxID=3914 RepID=A0A0L9U543_PHAAN|nr:uncharacterized protein HKW66_Vig0244320 [Vigna angularis]KOM37797.1 hypothetical protein LR48_Vigan03g117900 [Vigna angularis]
MAPFCNLVMWCSSTVRGQDQMPNVHERLDEIVARSPLKLCQQLGDVAITIEGSRGDFGGCAWCRLPAVKEELSKLEVVKRSSASSTTKEELDKLEEPGRSSTSLDSYEGARQA